MSEQPPRASSQTPLPGEASPQRADPLPGAASPQRLDPRPGAPPLREPRRDEAEERIRERAGEGLDRAADAARRLGHVARDRGGIAAQAEPLAYRVGDSLQSAAAYVREHELADMRDDVEGGVRRSPIRALALAALGGFLLGRMLR